MRRVIQPKGAPKFIGDTDHTEDEVRLITFRNPQTNIEGVCTGIIDPSRSTTTDTAVILFSAGCLHEPPYMVRTAFITTVGRI